MIKPNPGETREKFWERFSAAVADSLPDEEARRRACDAAWSSRYVGEHSIVAMCDRATSRPVRRTRDGYLAAEARVARTGIQTYLGSEVGRPALDTVRVYRPEEEVFDEESLHSYAYRPLTSNHPSELVTSKTWRRVAVGYVGDKVVRDGEFVSVPLVLMDADAIREYEDGKRELSLGYETELVWGEGISPSGEKYDAVQTNIRANHLAVVAAARGGPELRIGDESRSKEKMTEKPLKTITIDGLSVEVTDMAASVIAKMIASSDAALKKLSDENTRLKDEYETAEEKRKREEEEKKKAMEAKDAEIVTLRKQLEDAKLTPAKLDQLVTERADVMGKARAVLGDKLVVDGKTDAEIRRQVVDAKMGDAAKGWSDDAVTASFRTICASVQADSSRIDPLAVAIGAGHGTADPRVAAYDAYEKDLTNAWKGATRQ